MKSEKHGKRVRICGRCGCTEDVSPLLKVGKRLSDNGWLCEDCYEDAADDGDTRY